MSAPNPTLKEYRIPAAMMQALGTLVFEQPAGRVLDLAVDLRALCAQQEAAGEPAPPAPSLDVMVDRFLAWPLPADVHPDGGVNVNPNARAKDWSASGTNLLSGVNARAMLQHVLGLEP